MADPLHRIKLGIARERVRLALRAFSEEPTEANAREVELAKRHWHLAKRRPASRVSARQSQIGHIRRSDVRWYDALLNRH